MTVKKEPRIYQADFLTELFRHPLDPAYEQAAEARKRNGPLKKPQLVVRKTVTFIVLTIIGALLAVAYQQVIREAPDKEKVRAGLIEQILQKRDSTRALAQTAEQLQAEVAALRDAAIGDPAQIEALRQLDAITGQRKITGDGVVIKISDGPHAATVRQQQINHYDLMIIVNQLWALGADGIAINGQRLTSLTQISSGSGISVGSELVVNPYEIVAVGPSDLDRRFTKSVIGGVYLQYRDDPRFRFGFSVEAKDDLTLPAAVLPPELTHAKVPAPAGSPSATPSSSPSGGGR
ncbi:DUF881 domain-containing protein [Catelliglobosispora koreensis]|uniref:DUF881 domain-containing protein n=1 Tax=Catelliglobosispora koreensis TaxID=129052 RepID=UPI000366F1B0|nr:DUF881 domain-containing protein [Catelliglobosispora koreensis]